MAAPEDLLVQEFVPGVEFGVFYARLPTERDGRIISITEKRMPLVTGDGRRRLEQLIWDDRRAVAMARTYVDALIERVDEVPAVGESVRLVDLGTHCRGAVFLDGAAHRTPALSSEIDALSKRFEGFHFGRYDIRVPSAEDLENGRNLKVIELNGVSSEATHVYDPRYGLRQAHRVLLDQWRLAYRIGRENVLAGHPSTSLPQLARILARHWTSRG